tara:strand:- start:248 stop:460 length:213 start_codon:yes stop_codon:yes gene_type:complete
MTLTKANSTVSQSEKGNLYITHPDFKTNLRFYAEVKELKGDWRTRVALREGDDNSFYAVLAKTAMTVLDV